MSGVRVHHYFPEEFLALNEEVQKHEELCRALANIPQAEVSEKIARIAAWVNIAMDDYYTEEDLRKIAVLCIQRLQARRGSLILPHSTTRQ